MKIEHVFENRFFLVGSLTAVIGGLLADSYNNGYLIIVSIIAFFIVMAFYEERQNQAIYFKETIPIPLVIKVDDGTSTDNAFDNLISEIEKEEKFCQLEKNLKKHFNVIREELIFEYNGSLYDTDRLISFVQIIRYQLNQLETRLNNKVVFHLAYYRRPAIGFVVGTIFRTNELVVYQKNDAQDTFVKVADINTRRYKETVQYFKKFTIEEKYNQESKVLVVIDASSHLVNVKAKELEDYQNIVHLKANHKGTITKGEDWILYAQEIYTVINQLQTIYKKITIVHAMPEALSVIIGMACENYWDIALTQYDNGNYKSVIRLNSYKYYF